MKVKVIYGSDIRRWHSSQNHQFEALLQFVKETFNFSAQENYNLQFEDDEGDRMTLSCKNDLKDALDIAEQENRKSLKIYVVLTEVNNSQDILNNNAIQVPELVTSPQSEPLVLPVEEPKTWQECMNDFFTNESINVLLPDFIREIMKRLRNNRNSSLKMVLMEVLSLEEFNVINSHELFTNFVKKYLDCISERAALLLPVLLTFSDDHVISIIPQLAETATQMLLGASSDVELDVTPIFERLFPEWVAMMNANNPDGCEIDLSHIFGTQNANESAATMMSASHDNEQKEEESRHDNIICDMCNVRPICGVRYKCAVCANFDMCSKCEATGTHNKNHALLKFRVPYSGFQRGRMRGLKEMFWRGHCRRGRQAQCFNPHFNCNQSNQELKKQKKLQEQLKKLEKKQKDVHQKLQKLNKNSTSEDCEAPVCKCGSRMTKLLAGHAYHHSVQEIGCDICEKVVGRDAEIYHCPQQGHLAHPYGYDICIQCVSNQKKPQIPNEREVTPEFELQAEREPTPEIAICESPQKIEREPTPEIAICEFPQKIEREPTPEIAICEFPPKIEREPTPEIAICEFPPKIEREPTPEIAICEFPSQVPPKVEIEQANLVSINDFPYQEQLNLLLQMGFDQEAAKGELIKSNGDIQQAVQSLVDL